MQLIHNLGYFVVVKKTRGNHKIIYCNPEHLRLEALLIFTIIAKLFPCAIRLRFIVMLLAPHKHVGMLVCICLCHMQSKTRIPPALFSFFFFYCTPPKSDQLLPRCCLLQMATLLKSELISSQGFVTVVIVFCCHLGGWSPHCRYHWPLSPLFCQPACGWLWRRACSTVPVVLGNLCLVPLFNLSKN